MVKNGMAQPLGLEPSAGCKREGAVAGEQHTQAESGPAPRGDGMVRWLSNRGGPQRDELTAEMGRPVKEDGMTPGLK